MEYIFIPYFSLKPNAITIFEKPETRFFSSAQIKTFDNLKNNENKYGEISENSQKRLRKMVDFMIYITKEKSITAHRIVNKSAGEEFFIEKGEKYSKSVKYRLTFITLTLPSTQVHTDEVIKKEALNHFLTVLRSKFKSELYIWKAEKQENCNIHFHILCDQYIHHSNLRETWNRIINKPSLAYVDRYSERMKEFFKHGFKMLTGDKRSKEKQLKAYELNKKIGWTSPNSTDIHALYKVKNLSAYIVKYIAKNVTKSKRAERIQFLRGSIDRISEQLELLKFEETFSAPNPMRGSYIKDITNELESNKKELEELAAKGVSGRIWGCSQKLSRCKNFVEVSAYHDIPDISIIEKYATYRKILKVGSSNILTYVFDIQKTKNLKCILDTHLAQSIKDSLL